MVWFPINPTSNGDKPDLNEAASARSVDQANEGPLVSWHRRFRPMSQPRTDRSECEGRPLVSWHRRRSKPEPQSDSS